MYWLFKFLFVWVCVQHHYQRLLLLYISGGRVTYGHIIFLKSIMFYLVCNDICASTFAVFYMNILKKERSKLTISLYQLYVGYLEKDKYNCRSYY